MGHCHEPLSDHCIECELPQLDRNHYFTGKLMVERDFTDEQRYTMGKLRRHNLRLHGHGIVCGLKVKQHPNPSCRHRYVIVEPGTALDCCGREILVAHEETVDFRTLYTDAWKALHGTDAEPDEKPHRFQLCIRYRECPTEPMPALFNDCSCDDTACQPNRIHESYEFGVIIDPAPKVEDPGSVTLDWHATIALAHAAHVAAGPDTLFVSTRDTLYAVDAHNLSVLASCTFAGRTLTQLRLSVDGHTLFALMGGGTDPEIAVLTADDITKPALNTQTIAGADPAKLQLATSPDGRLFALDAVHQQLSVWAADITGAAPAAPANVPLTGTSDGLALSSDGRFAFVATGDGGELAVIDTALLAIAQSIPIGTVGTTRPRALAVLDSAEGANVAVLDPDHQLLYFVGWRPAAATPADRAPVLATPLGGFAFAAAALAAGPGSRWVFLGETDAATQRSYVQPLDTHAWMLAQPGPLKLAVSAGHAATELSVLGDHVYVAYAGDDRSDPGGVAVLDLSGGDCDAIFARSLDGCPTCDVECEVLATVADYAYDHDVTDAAIDNLVDRKLLPSTDAIVEVIQCILANCCHGGGTGTTGPIGPAGPGVKSADAETVPNGTPASATFDPATGNLHLKIPAGPDGAAGGPGAGVKTADAEDVPFGTPAEATFNPATGNIHFKIPGGAPGNDGSPTTLDLPHVVGLNWSHDGQLKITEANKLFAKGLLVAFDRPMWAETLDEHTVQLLYSAPVAQQDKTPFDTRCFCNVVCRVEAVKTERKVKCGDDLQGISVEVIPAGPATAVRLLPMRNNEPVREWARGEYRVVLEGDQILGIKKTALPDPLKAGKTIEAFPALDGNHLGPGLLGPKSRLVNHPELGQRRCPTGDGAEGGRFLSWFTLA